MSSSLRIGVMRGGPSSEYEVSLNTGKNVLEALAAHPSYHPVDIFIDRNGVWHLEGHPLVPATLPLHVDVVFNALHGTYGEDGQLQQVLETLRVPYTGSGVLASALAMHKGRAKEMFKQAAIPVAPSATFDAGVDAPSLLQDIFRRIPPPYIVKPLSGGSSVGIRIAHSYPELHEAVYDVAASSPEILIETLIQGREATCGVIDGFRGQDIYALLPVEIVPPDSSSFFDYEAKYGGGTQEICPGRFSSEEMHTLQEYAKKAHDVLGLRDYSRSDFIVTPRNIVILETNSLPGLTGESLLPKSLRAVGAGIHEFLEHLIERAHSRR